jgi:hypothetical protein
MNYKVFLFLLTCGAYTQTKCGRFVRPEDETWYKENKEQYMESFRKRVLKNATEKTHPYHENRGKTEGVMHDVYQKCQILAGEQTKRAESDYKATLNNSNPDTSIGYRLPPDLYSSLHHDFSNECLAYVIRQLNGLRGNDIYRLPALQELNDQVNQSIVKKCTSSKKQESHDLQDCVKTRARELKEIITHFQSKENQAENFQALRAWIESSEEISRN